jgi:hypothetical protein
LTTVRIANSVHDYESWQQAFDKFERFRADHGVRSYRIVRQVSDPSEVSIDLEFGSLAEAEAFVPLLARIWSTPQSREELVSHGAPTILDEVRRRVLEPNTPSEFG